MIGSAWTSILQPRRLAAYHLSVLSGKDTYDTWVAIVSDSLLWVRG